MNNKERAILIQAACTLELLGHPKESKAINRIMDAAIRARPEYEAAFNYYSDAPVGTRQAFAYWFTESGRTDLEQAHSEYVARA